MHRWITFFLITMIIFSIIASLFILVGAAYLHQYSKNTVNEELLEKVRSSKENEFFSYERSGDYINPTPILINQAHQKRTGYVTYDNIPRNLINAFVSIEDKRFFSHHGIDYLRSSHAIVNYLSGSKNGFGGSTITQQLIKNVTGNDKRLIERKLSEAFCALDFETKYDKTEILEMYLNVINLANGCIGIDEAADFYFSKTVSELSLTECACLAAIVKNPSQYDPIAHPDKNEKRARTVLFCMLEQGYITKSEYAEATSQPLCAFLNCKNKERSYNSWYIDAVIEDVISDLAQKYGISRQSASVIFYKGGYRVYTAMNSKIQAEVDKYYYDLNNFSFNGHYDGLQSSMIIIDPDTGDVLALAGAVGHKKGDRILNYATQTKRPPGSTIKPLSVYALAIEKGIVNWSSIIDDSPIRTLPNGSPWPLNANRKYAGKVTLKFAIQNSLNTVPVKLLQQIGNRESFNFLTKKLMISSLNEKHDMGDASLALGQPSVGMTLRELVSAYTIFNDGIMRRSRTYYKVTDYNGQVILDNSPNEDQIITEESAAIMTKLLECVIQSGTAEGYITLNDITEVAGKTGTTQGNQDKYFVGYTPSLLAGVWTGYAEPRSLDSIGGNISALIWDDIMNTVYERSELSYEQHFRIPSTLRKYSYSSYDGNLPQNYIIPENIEEGWFVYDDPLLCIK